MLSGSSNTRKKTITALSRSCTTSCRSDLSLRRYDIALEVISEEN